MLNFTSTEDTLLDVKTDGLYRVFQEE